MKKNAKRILSLLLVLSFVLTAFPLTVGANEEVVAEEKEETIGDYTDLYAKKEQAKLLWNAFDKDVGDKVSETAFATSASASYGKGYLDNNAAAIDLTKYLPNFEYGNQVAQKDYTVELVMSAEYPTESGEGTVGSRTWYFGNFATSVYVNRIESADYKNGEGPLLGYTGHFKGDLVDTNLNFNFNRKGKLFFGTKPLEAFTSTAVFDLELGEAPATDAASLTDTILMCFYRDGQRIQIASNHVTNTPIPYDATNKNDVLKVGETINTASALNFYAIRVYEAALTEQEIEQNHFADLVGFFGIPLDSYSALSKMEREFVHSAVSDILLTDKDVKARVLDLIEEITSYKLYVLDVDGDEKIDLKFFFDAYGAKQGDEIGTAVADKLGNTLTVSADASYNDDALYLKGTALDLTSVYDASEDIYLEMVLAQTGDRVGKSENSVIGPTGNISISTRNESDSADTQPIDESYGVVSGTYWAPGNWGTDVSWNKVRFLGAYPKDIYTIAYSVDKDMAAKTYQLSYVRDGMIVMGPSSAKEIGTDTQIKFGANFCVNYYAIRLYTKVLSKEQINQNHFADLVNYLDLDVDDYLLLPEMLQKLVHSELSAVALHDKNAEEEYEKAILKAEKLALYVLDTDGDNESNATLLWNAFDKRAGDTVSESAFTVSSSAVYGDGYLYNNAEEFNLTEYLPNFDYGGQTAQNDYTIELAMSTPAATDEGTGNNGNGMWYFGSFQGQFYYRHKNNEYTATDGPALAYFGKVNGAYKETGKNVDFNLNKGYGYFFGRKADVSYTSAITFDYTLGETPNKDVDTMTFDFYNNATRLEHTRYEGTLPYDAASSLDSLRIGLKVKLNYYAIRIYNDILTVEEMRQNHFADLALHAEIDNLKTFKSLSEESKQALYLAFNEVCLTDGRDVNKARLESAIDASYAAERGVTAENYVSFLGYQVRLTGEYAGLRALYTVNQAEDASVLEIGAIMAIADGREVSMLTVENAQKDGMHMAKDAVYAEGVWADANIFTHKENEEELSCFAYTTMYDTAFAETKYDCEMLYRAYVTLSLDGQTVTLYADMTDSFDTVSLLSVTEALVAKDQKIAAFTPVAKVLSAKGDIE